MTDSLFKERWTNVAMYGKSWSVDDSKGQTGLLAENHYRALFSPQHRDTSLGRRDRWLDIGANIGAFAIRAADFVDMVVAVEPEPDNIRCLGTNIRLNQCTNIIVLTCAIVGDNSKTVYLSLSNTYSSTHRVGKIRGRKFIEVPAKNIDGVVEDHGINKIKMDCEGSEIEILETMNLEPVDEIIFEYHFSFIKDRPWGRYFAILKRLQDAGFLILRGPMEESKTWHSIVWAKKP